MVNKNFKKRNKKEKNILNKIYLFKFKKNNEKYVYKNLRKKNT